jgi:outer membrane protein assembly factor BamB
MVFTREELERTSRLRKKYRRIIWLASTGAILVVLALVVLFQITDVFSRVNATVQSSPQNSDWTMFHRDSAHTGSTAPDSTVAQGKIKWTFTTGAAIHSSPAVAGGVVYFGSRDSNVYAVKADTGEMLWSFKTGSWVESSPVVTNGVVYIGSNDGKFYALDALTGKQRWSFTMDFGVRSTAAVADGVVYFGSDDYHIYALKASTGKVLWKRRTGTEVTSSPVVSQGVLVAAMGDNYLEIVNAGNGSQRLAFQTNCPIDTSPAVANGVAYFGDFFGYLHAVDIKARNWPLENFLTIYWQMLYVYQTAPKPPLPSGYIWSQKLVAKTKQMSSPVIFGGNMYLGGANSLYSFDLNTLTTTWTFNTDNVVSATPAVTDKAVYFGGQDGKIYAIDRASGKKLWEIATQDQITSSPAEDKGVVYVASHDGKLYAIQ